MKNIFCLTVIFLSMSFIIQPVNLIVGKWLSIEESGESNILEFSANGRFNQTVYLDSTYNNDTMELSGTYWVRQDSLFVKYSNATEREVYKITTLTKTKLCFHAYNNEEPFITCFKKGR